MSKSLEALERLRNTLLAEGYWQDILQDVSIIEKELKRLEEIDDILNTGGGIWATNGPVGKELKAIKIIKEKGIDIIALKECKKAKTYNENTKRTYCEEYTEEEYDLLKEVLRI